MAKILIVNPNTTASMTKTIGEAARAVAAPGTEIVDVTSAMGPVSIEGFYDEAFAVPGLIQALLNAPDADAGIIACFDDTGLDAARSVAPFPVVGICEAALVTAGQLAKRIGVVTTLPRSIVPLEELVRRYGFAERAQVTACNVAVLDLEKPGSGAEQNSTPRLRGRWTRARRPSCSVAPGWPISPQNCRKNSAFPSSTASRPR